MTVVDSAALILLTQEVLMVSFSPQVAQQWIVTASHCVEAGGDGQFTVIAGSVHRIDFSVHQQVRVRSYHDISSSILAFQNVRHCFRLGSFIRTVLLICFLSSCVSVVALHFKFHVLNCLSSSILTRRGSSI